MSQPTIPVNIRQCSNGLWSTEHVRALAEIPVMVTVNGEPWLEFMCTPEYLEALAVGFLYNEGLIESAVQLADNWSMTLIGYAHDERFKVYAHLERIEVR